jgi:putative nucleotidyltransferase with HDIG domain
LGALAVVAVVALTMAAVASLRAARRRPSPDDQSWREHRVAGSALAAFAHLFPVGSGLGVSLVLAGHLRHHRWTETIATWAVLAVVATAVMVLVDRLTRRLLPLAALCKLSLVFPDRSPRRLAVARKAAHIRDIRAQLEHGHHGVPEDAGTAAARIVALVAALHAHDRRTRGHSERVRVLTDMLADELRLRRSDRDKLRWAALLHDVGKLEVPGRLLNKPGKLSPREWSTIHKHPEAGDRITAALRPWLGTWAPTIIEHHERWDGSGYPHGHAGTELSLGARIVGVADAYEVMTAGRIYKRPMSAAAARAELAQGAGSQFDPAVVRAFLNISLGRLRVAIGPLAWVAGTPAFGWLQGIQTVTAVGAERAATIATAATGAAALTAGGALMSAAPPVPVPAADFDAPVTAIASAAPDPPSVVTAPTALMATSSTAVTDAPEESPPPVAGGPDAGSTGGPPTAGPTPSPAADAVTDPAPAAPTATPAGPSSSASPTATTHANPHATSPNGKGQKPPNANNPARTLVAAAGTALDVPTR